MNTYDDIDEYELEYDGFFFKLFIYDYWYKIYRGKKKEPLFQDYRVMLDMLKKVDKSKYMLDIGMNHGLFAVPASKLGYKVFGFEPVVKNVFSLMLAKEVNNLTDFDIFHFALSNKNEEVEIYVPECPDNSSLNQIAAIANMNRKDFSVEKVNAIRFDDWIEQNPKYKDIGYIKMDVQGAEYSIIEGMTNYLKDAHDIYMICEYDNNLLDAFGHTREELDNLILSFGFTYHSYVANDKFWYKP